MAEERQSPPPTEIVVRVRQSFIIFQAEPFLEPLELYFEQNSGWEGCVRVAVEGLRSVINAAGLPFQLVQDSVSQRRFDRFHMSERILGLKAEDPGTGLSKESERSALTSARKMMGDFLSSSEGRDFMRDEIIYELNSRLNSQDVQVSAQELLNQTLISTWSIFESFARSFIISWIDANPGYAAPVLASPDLKDYLGKQVVDIKTIDEHGFDLSKSMGSILFRGRRLDSLKVIRGVTKALFNDADIQTSLGSDLWLLNQRRHLFVHNRGVVDADYLSNTSDPAKLGDRLLLKSEDIKQHLVAVHSAIVCIAKAAEQQQRA